MNLILNKNNFKSIYNLNMTIVQIKHTFNTVFMKRKFLFDVTEDIVGINVGY